MGWNVGIERTSTPIQKLQDELEGYQGSSSYGVGSSKRREREFDSHLDQVISRTHSSILGNLSAKNSGRRRISYASTARTWRRYRRRGNHFSAKVHRANQGRTRFCFPKWQRHWRGSVGLDSGIKQCPGATFEISVSRCRRNRRSGGPVCHKCNCTCAAQKGKRQPS